MCHLAAHKPCHHHAVTLVNWSPLHLTQLSAPLHTRGRPLAVPMQRDVRVLHIAVLQASGWGQVEDLGHGRGARHQRGVHGAPSGEQQSSKLQSSTSNRCRLGSRGDGARHPVHACSTKRPGAISFNSNEQRLRSKLKCSCRAPVPQPSPLPLPLPHRWWMPTAWPPPPMTWRSVSSAPTKKCAPRRSPRRRP